MVFMVCSSLYLFVYRYQGLSTTCPVFGTAWVQHLSITCPKIEHLDTAPLKGIVGWGIDDIVPMVEFLDTAMVSGFGTDLGKAHDLFPVDIEPIPKEIVVPQLEQGHIQTDMGRVQSAVLGKLVEHAIEVLDIIDFFQKDAISGYGPCSAPTLP